MTDLSIKNIAPYPLKQARHSHPAQDVLRGASITVEKLIDRFASVPSMTALLGMVGEDLPVLFDLSDSKPGSILMVNDHLPSLRRLMMVMVQTIGAYTSSYDFQYVVISDFPEKWMEAVAAFDNNYAYCAGVVGGYENSAEDWILFLANKAEARINGKQKGAALVLFIDDISLIEKMDMQVRLNYEWLLKYGAQAQIWLVAGLDLQKDCNYQKYLEQFKTKIYGQVEDRMAQKLTPWVPDSIIKQLQPNSEFCHQNWFRVDPFLGTKIARINRRGNPNDRYALV